MKDRLRRWAETCVVLGLCLMAVSAVAWADDPAPAAEPAVPAVETATPEPLATATATATAVLTPAPEATVAASPTAAATATAEATVPADVTPTASPAPSATASATAIASPPIVVAERPQPTRRPRQAATATPTATATSEPAEDYAGATLTLCHYDSATGAYQSVTIDAGKDSVYFSPTPEYELDVIPAPVAGCASIDPADPGEASRRRMLICHFTGNPEQPYALLGPFRGNDLLGHELHRGDLIPAPEGTCPGLGPYAVPTPVTTPEPDPDPDPTSTASAEPSVAPTAEPTATATAAPGDGGSGGSVAGVVSGSAPAAPAATAEQLPFTGFELWLIASAGLGLALMGAGLRLIAA